VFCPRVDPNVYPNRNLHLNVETTEKICNDLANVNFLGRISVSGFGEPFLNKQLFEIVSAIKQILPNNIVDVNTNGDQLTVDNIRTSFASGLDLMYVNLYDGPEQITKFTELFNSANITTDKYILREHWPNIDNTYNLILNNRGGTLRHINEPIRQKCYFPFSKAMIDYNGDLLLCPQDWSRSYIIGSLLEHSIKDLWLGERMRNIRTKLMNSDRSNSPCNQCDSDGTLTGLYSFKTLTNYYKNVQVD
jgi:radical SAM protein with 4Fe4S-binding SPASM domain